MDLYSGVFRFIYLLEYIFYYGAMIVVDSKLLFLVEILALVFFVSFFMFFVVTAITLKKRANIKEKLKACNYVALGDSVSKKAYPFTIKDIRLDNKFFNLKAWPENIGEDIREDLQANLFWERLSFIVKIVCPTTYFLIFLLALIM
ncbi:hypothetical protein [Aliidiomarina celeris]|uniref:hypothetical protein n=1 Tax=Aliidiomarina celeris TaxID=2249428 RepID=UPI0013004E09|nr:hypothetical protein [Aliidiomarina celeris]